MRLEVVLRALALRHPHREAVVCGPVRLNYAQLVASVDEVAGGLRAAGVGPGDRVLLYLPNGIEFILLMYAAFDVGAIVVPVNTRLTARELEYFIEDARPALVAVDRASLGTLQPHLQKFPGLQVLGVARGEPLAASLPQGDAPRQTVPADPADCMIIYTSGTTGRPKGAIITHANVLVQHGFINGLEWGISGEDRYLVTTPLAHRTGLGRLGNALTLGGTLVVMEKFDPAGVLDTIERERITVIGMVPTVARMMMPALETGAARCASLRRIIVTGEAFPVELKRKVMGLLPQVGIYSFFAMTEVGCVTSLGPQEQLTHPASVGRPTPGVEVRLVDEAGREVPTGEAGELLVRSGAAGRFTIMRGYYNRPAETAEALRDDWLHTGDMARIDADGYLYIVDRKKDMVLSGGFNIYTKEVEQVLVSHPAVADAAVVGVPDATYGEAVAAFIEPVPGATLTEAELIEFCRTEIASYKKPRHVFFLAELPRNPMGKVLKHELREKAISLATAEHA